MENWSPSDWKELSETGLALKCFTKRWWQSSRWEDLWDTGNKSPTTVFPTGTHQDACNYITCTSRDDVTEGQVCAQMLAEFLKDKPMAFSPAVTVWVKLSTQLMHNTARRVKLCWVMGTECMQAFNCEMLQVSVSEGKQKSMGFRMWVKGKMRL